MQLNETNQIFKNKRSFSLANFLFHGKSNDLFRIFIPLLQQPGTNKRFSLEKGEKILTLIKQWVYWVDFEWLIELCK